MSLLSGSMICGMFASAAVAAEGWALFSVVTDVCCAFISGDDRVR